MKFSLIFILFLTGCLTTPQKTATYSNPEIGVPSAEQAVVIVYRKVVAPFIYPVSASINQKRFTTLTNNTFSWAYLPKGNHSLKITWPLLALTPGKTLELEVEAGKYYVVEFTGNTEIAGVGAIVYSTHDLSVNSSEQQLQVVKDCCRYVPSAL
jgi:hypothetical protein